MKLTPKHWSDFQHYKDRSPTWIKLHRKLLDDYAFNCLPLASRALAPMLWLLASEYEGGCITASPAEIAFRLRMTEAELMAALKPLIKSGFFNDASNALAECKHDASLETERETERETETEAEAEAEARAHTHRPRRATRLPETWSPSAAGMAYARERLSDDRVEAELENFRDYWHARAGPGAVKLDWEATWRTWVRRAATDNRRDWNGANRKIGGFAELTARLSRAASAAAGDGPNDAARPVVMSGADDR